VDAAAALVIVGMFWIPPIADAAGTWRSVIGSALAVLAAAAMLSRWRLPASSATAAAVATVAASVLGVCQDPMLAAAWCLYPVALTHASRTRILVLVPAGVVAALAAVTAAPSQAPGGAGQRLVLAAAALSVAWLLGVIVGRQIASVREAERARADEQATRVQLDVARDVHDVVGHALSVIGAEAGVVRSLPDAGEQELRDTLADIEGHARIALQDIQSLVRSLRDDPGHAAASSPGISAVPSLIAAARLAGVSVDARIAAPDHVDNAVGAAAFRIVQEALSNVVRHAPGSACAVELRADGDALVIRVRDDGPGTREGDADGFGLRGMRERALLVGGTVTCRNLPERGFEMEARLPRGGAT
jgi:signal transduction histidine kinase